MWCYWCAKPCKKLTRDHLVPVGLGGDEWDKSNTVRACEKCNNERSQLTNLVRGVPRPNKPLDPAVIRRWIDAEIVALGFSPHASLIGSEGKGV